MSNELSTLPPPPNDYSDASFWEKVAKCARLAGREVIEKSLWLYYAAQSPKTPAWARTVILGALAYFILPADAIPDVLPLVGFTDDLGAIMAALAMVAVFIDKDVKEQAAKKLSDWFGTP